MKKKNRKRKRRSEKRFVLWAGIIGVILLLIGGVCLVLLFGQKKEPDTGKAVALQESGETLRLTKEDAVKETTEQDTEKAGEETAEQDTEKAGEETAEQDTEKAGEETGYPVHGGSEEETTAFFENSEESAVNHPPADPDSVIDLSTTLYTYEKMEGDLHTLASCYPEYMTLDTLGTTADGRNLYAVYFGNRNAARQIVICAATHAREYMTTQLVMKQLEQYCAQYETGSYGGKTYAEIFDQTCFVLVPMVNPDGVTISQLGEAGLTRQDLVLNLRNIYASDAALGLTEGNDYAQYLTRWKANGVGVDLNRNYSPGWESVSDRSLPSSSLYKGTEPGSEAESQALMNLVNSLGNPILAVSYHSYGGLVYWQYGQEEPLWSENEMLAQNISNLTGYYLAGYSNEAGFSNWCVRVKGIPSVTVETGVVPCPLPLSEFASLWQQNQYMWVMLGSIYG